ncbi:hypothetical protein M427DRAFT_53177 [Gonapodya prolifera JEL478]|uniref:Uncharacterized protein n=1 Tax=Gonapodya prolifera (strain JEL478) TaxID=1344416 RepID=A0A139AR43_GONPJ|nr:hypothetical protein M427DRAFT_53177 [Gonapodya prolifera JEL478]|eukprot:KXS19220.1 hypothetical protein M427DRAFT_53177 [Gonapodya prolifera JEL478]
MRQNERRRVALLKLLAGIPKPARKAIVRALDESMDSLIIDAQSDEEDKADEKESGEGMDATRSLREPDASGSGKVSVTKLLFWAGSLLVTASCLVIFAPSVIGIAYLRSFGTFQERAAEQRYLFQYTMMMNTEVAAHDAQYWEQGDAEMLLKYTIKTLEEKHRLVRIGVGNIPGTDSVRDLDDLLLNGGTCLLSGGCDKLVYNATIGFSKATVYNGLETITRAFLDASADFLSAPSAQRTTAHDNWRLAYALSAFMKDGLLQESETVYNLVLNSLQMTSTLTTLVFSFACVIIAAVGVFVFRRIVMELFEQANELVDIAFSVPRHLLPPTSAFLRCLDSGGLALEMDDARG